jgi:hypothetical protein
MTHLWPGADRLALGTYFRRIIDCGGTTMLPLVIIDVV